jgi:hypothetical protein
MWLSAAPCKMWQRKIHRPDSIPLSNETLPEGNTKGNTEMFNLRSMYSAK